MRPRAGGRKDPRNAPVVVQAIQWLADIDIRNVTIKYKSMDKSRKTFPIILQNLNVQQPKFGRPTKLHNIADSVA
jgi:hypothetical protein